MLVSKNGIKMSCELDLATRFSRVILADTQFQGNMAPSSVVVYLTSATSTASRDHFYDLATRCYKSFTVFLEISDVFLRQASDTCIRDFIICLSKYTCGIKCQIQSQPSPQVVDRICDVIRACNNLKKLDLENCAEVALDQLFAICFAGARVQTLLLAGCTQLDDHYLRRILLNFPLIEELSVRRCCGISEKAFEKVFANVPHLKKIDASETLIVQSACKELDALSSEIFSNESSSMHCKANDLVLVDHFSTHLKSIFIGSSVNLWDGQIWIDLRNSKATEGVLPVTLLPRVFFPLLTKYQVVLRIDHGAVISDSITNAHVNFFHEVRAFIKTLDIRGSNSSYRALAYVLGSFKDFERIVFSLPKNPDEISTLSQTEIQVLLFPIFAMGSSRSETVVEQLLERMIIQPDNFLKMLQMASIHHLIALQVKCRHWFFSECSQYVKIECNKDIVTVDFQDVTCFDSFNSEEGQKLLWVLRTLQNCSRIEVIFRFEKSYSSKSVAEILKILTEQARNLVKLSFIQRHGLKNSSECIYSGIFNGDMVEILELEGFQLSESDFVALARRYRSVSSLLLTKCSRSIVKALVKCYATFSGLKKIGFLSGSDLQHEDLVAVVESYKALTSLMLTGCRLVTDQTIQVVTNELSGLKELVVEDCGITDAAFSRDGFGKLKLSELSLAGTLVTGQGLDVLVNLERLDLSGTSIDANQLHMILSAACRLKSLKLSGCKNIDTQMLNIVGACCNQLQTLCLDNCSGVTEEALFILLTKCRQLTCIQVQGCPELHPRIRGQCIKIDTCIKTLKLDLSEGLSVWAIALMFKIYPNIKSVRIVKCENLTVELLESILVWSKNACKRLSHFNLESYPKAIAVEVVRLIGQHLPHLKGLSLNGVVVPRVLEELHVFGGLQVLNLTHEANEACQIDDASASLLSSCCRTLQKATFSNFTSITDEFGRSLCFALSDLHRIRFDRCDKVNKERLASTNKVQIL